LEAIDDLALRFETPGLLAKVNVKEGQMVKNGTILANLRLSELNAAVSQAVANLNQRLAGATVEDKAYYQSAVASSKASLDQAKLDAVNQIADAEAAVLTAQNNLRLASGGNDSQIVTQAYENAVTVLQATLPKLEDALTQADNVLGVDNTTGGTSYQPYISANNPSIVNEAKFSYVSAKNERNTARAMISVLTPSASGRTRRRTTPPCCKPSRRCQTWFFPPKPLRRPPHPARLSFSARPRAPTRSPASIPTVACCPNHRARF
jgi:multidrug efflux pump subunit AcrA (membrane-fusion protein)